VLCARRTLVPLVALLTSPGLAIAFGFIQALGHTGVANPPLDRLGVDPVDAGMWTGRLGNHALALGYDLTPGWP
jgi:hypothetical protein